MITNKKGYQYKLLLYPLLVLIFFPFPSKYIGYSAALYLCDIALLGCIMFYSIRSKYRFILNNTMKFLLFLVMLNIISIAIAIIKGNESSIRQIAEIFRTIEWIIIYNFLFNVFNKNKDKIDFYEVTKKSIVVILLILIPFVIIELFNLPLKPILRSMYEMGKSGNIYQYYNRIVGTFRNPNFFGIAISILLIFIYLCKLKVLLKVFLLLSCSVMLYFSGSRTAIIVFMIMLFITFIFQISRKSIKLFSKQLLVISIFIFLIIIIVSNNPELFYSIRLNISIKDLMTVGERTTLWLNNKEIIMNNIIMGNGIVKGSKYMLDNLYLQYILYYGLFGFIFIITFYIRNFYKALKLCIIKKSDFVLFFFLIQVCFIVVGFTTQIGDALQIVYWYLMSVAYIDSQKRKSNSSIY